MSCRCAEQAADSAGMPRASRRLERWRTQEPPSRRLPGHPIAVKSWPLSRRREACKERARVGRLAASGKLSLGLAKRRCATLRVRSGQLWASECYVPLTQAGHSLPRGVMYGVNHTHPMMLTKKTRNAPGLATELCFT